MGRREGKSTAAGDFWGWIRADAPERGGGMGGHWALGTGAVVLVGISVARDPHSPGQPSSQRPPTLWSFIRTLRKPNVRWCHSTEARKQ